VSAWLRRRALAALLILLLPYGGPVWYPWEDVTPSDAPANPHIWQRVPRAFYTLQDCVDWAGWVMKIDISEVLRCQKAGRRILP